MEEQSGVSNGTEKKWKTGFHLMLFLDGKDGMIRQVGISKGFVQTMVVIILLLIIVPFVGWKKSNDKIYEQQGKLNKLQGQLDQATAQCEELSVQKAALEEEASNLNNKVTILSDTVNAKVEKEMAMEKEVDIAHMPSCFPLSSSASMEHSEENDKRVVFTAEFGNVLAAGAGVVSEITSGDGYARKLTVDHENGYVSVYYNNGIPMVREGDQVLSNTVLFIIGDENGRLGYEVYKDGEAIDPMSVINIDG